MLHVKRTGGGLPLCTEGNGRHCYLVHTTVQGWWPRRPLTCVCAAGASIAITNCLNFAIPRRAHFIAIRANHSGVAEACVALGEPVFRARFFLQ